MGTAAGISTASGGAAAATTKAASTATIVAVTKWSAVGAVAGVLTLGAAHQLPPSRCLARRRGPDVRGGSGAAAPRSLIGSPCDRAPDLRDVELCQLLTLGDAPYTAVEPPRASHVPSVSLARRAKYAYHGIGAKLGRVVASENPVR